MTSRRTERKILLFKNRFEPLEQDHFAFACHAAFPVFFTPDLLYHIWMKFNAHPYTNSTPQKSNIIVVSDLLVSALCTEVGVELFEMDHEVRCFLLDTLKNDTRFGNERFEKLADFLYQYAQSAYRHPDQRYFNGMNHLKA